MNNNFKLLRRIWDEKRYDKYAVRSVIIKIFQNHSLVYKRNKMGVLGSKKKSRIQGTYYRDSTREHIRMILSLFGDSTFYYKFSDYVSDKIFNENIDVTGMTSFLDLLSNFFDEEEKFLRKDRGSWFKDLGLLVDYYHKYGIDIYKKPICWMISSSTRYYNNSESEWVINSDEFIIPDNSILYLKHFSGDIIKHNNDINSDMMGISNRNYDSKGLDSNEINNIKDKLSNKYNIIVLNNRFQIFNDLKNKI